MILRSCNEAPLRLYLENSCLRRFEALTPRMRRDFALLRHPAEDWQKPFNIRKFRVYSRRSLMALDLLA